MRSKDANWTSSWGLVEREGQQDQECKTDQAACHRAFSLSSEVLPHDPGALFDHREQYPRRACRAPARLLSAVLPQNFHPDEIRASAVCRHFGAELATNDYRLAHRSSSVHGLLQNNHSRKTKCLTDILCITVLPSASPLRTRIWAIRAKQAAIRKARSSADAQAHSAAAGSLKCSSD